MAKKRYSRSIENYTDFRRFDERNRQFWRGRYLAETGRENARGWNNSEQFKAYERARNQRIDTLAERNPGAYIDKAYYIERKAEREIKPIEQVAVYNSLSELSSKLATMEIKAKNEGRRFLVKMELDGREYIGQRAINEAIKRKTEEWRNQMKATKKDIDAGTATAAQMRDYGVIDLGGQFSLVDTGDAIIFSGEITEQ